MSTLVDIRNKVRRLTGRPSEQQISDDEINKFVNDFYQFDFPEHLRVFSNTTVFKFITIANVDQYDMREQDVSFNGGTEKAVNVFYNVQPPAYISGFQSFYSQNREQFFRTYPALGDTTITLVGNGNPGPYNFTLLNAPVLENSISIGAVDITGKTIRVVDDPPITKLTPHLGKWKESLLNTEITGQINYVTGALTITFPNSIPVGNEITIISTPYEANRPQAILFYDNIITLRPVPDKPYPVELNAFLTPTALLDANSPVLKQWWQYLAYGAAKKIFEDAQDPDGVTQILPEFKAQEQLVLNRHIVQQTNERTATIYTEMVSFPFGNQNNRF